MTGREWTTTNCIQQSTVLVLFWFDSAREDSELVASAFDEVDKRLNEIGI